jgi:hypothetical protein
MSGTRQLPWFSTNKWGRQFGRDAGHDADAFVGGKLV